jgi:hypothetical protein
VRLAVLTENPEEWKGFGDSQHSDGILLFHYAFTTKYLHRLAVATDQESILGMSLILLIDGFEALACDGDLRDSAHMLLRAPAPDGITPIVTLDTSSSAIPAAWLNCFQFRILARRRAADPTWGAEGVVHALSPIRGPQFQFSAESASSRLPFWLPALR